MSLPTSLQPTLPSTRRSFVVGFTLGLIVLAAVLFATWKSAQTLLSTSELVGKSRETLELGERAMKHVMEMESARRGYLLAGGENAKQEYEKARSDLADAFRSLKENTADRPGQFVQIDRMILLVSRIAEIHRREFEARRSGGSKEGAALFAAAGAGELMAELHGVHFDFDHAERVLLAERLELMESHGQFGRVVLIAGPLVTFLALGGAGILTLRHVGRRQRAEESLAQQANLLANIMDAMPDHVFVKDVKGRYVMHNRAHRLYLGLRATETIEGRTVFDFFPAGARRAIPGGRFSRHRNGRADPRS